MGLVILGATFLLLIVFIAQNTQSVRLTFFGWHGDVGWSSRCPLRPWPGF